MKLTTVISATTEVSKNCDGNLDLHGANCLPKGNPLSFWTGLDPLLGNH